MSKYKVIEESVDNENNAVTEQKKPKEKKKKAVKEKKGGIAKKSKETFSELKKVSWPSFGTVAKKTGIVLAFVAISLVALTLIDLLLGFLTNLLY